MSYRFKSEGIDEVMKAVAELEDKAMFVAAQSLYEGAGVMADEVSKAAKTIRTAPFHYVAVPGVITRLPSPEEKEILLKSGAVGVARFRKTLGAIDTSVGYNAAGYAPVNWNHMRSSARTNYKAVSLKGHAVNASSFLQAIRNRGGSEKYGIDANIGKGAQNMKPIGVIANAINSGTSFMKKQPFIRKAVKKATPKAEAAIIERAESLINTILSENQVGGKTA